MTMRLIITCDAAGCGAVIATQVVRQLRTVGRASFVDACSERCEAALRRQYGIAGEAGR